MHASHLRVSKRHGDNKSILYSFAYILKSVDLIDLLCFSQSRKYSCIPETDLPILVVNILEQCKIPRFTK